MLDDPLSAQPETVHDDLVGTLLADRYRLQRLIGHGGMASVYRADDELLDRPVAVKLFPPNATGPVDIRRETSEIRMLASLNHHALVTVFDANMTDSATEQRAYLVMELVDGKTLRHHIEDAPLAPHATALMAVDLAEALHVVHERGIVHRDVKPDNILLSPSPTPDRDFRAKLADFGIALLTDSTRITATGMVIGTAAYLSPEQARGEPPGPASDIYSLGLILLESLTGEKAYPGSVVESVAAKISTDPQIPSDLGYGWKSLLTAMTARDPDARPSAWDVAESARALIDDTGSEDPATTGIQPTNDVTGVLPVAAAAAANQPDVSSAPTALLPTSAEREDVFALPHPDMTDVIDATVGGPDTTDGVDATVARAKPGGAKVWILLVVIAVLVVAAAVAIILLITSGQPAGSAPAPSMPTVGGQLGEDLKDLMRSVTP